MTHKESKRGIFIFFIEIITFKFYFIFGSKGRLRITLHKGGGEGDGKEAELIVGETVYSQFQFMFYDLTNRAT